MSKKLPTVEISTLEVLIFRMLEFTQTLESQKLKLPRTPDGNGTTCCLQPLVLYSEMSNFQWFHIASTNLLESCRNPTRFQERF